MTKVGALRASVVSPLPPCLAPKFAPPRKSASTTPTTVPVAMATRETMMFQPKPSARKGDQTQRTSIVSPAVIVSWPCPARTGGRAAR